MSTRRDYAYEAPDHHQTILVPEPLTAEDRLRGIVAAVAYVAALLLAGAIERGF